MGTYRDEREASLAQNSALQQAVSGLERDKTDLAQRNAALERENASLRAVAGVPRRGGGAVRVVVALALLFVLLVTGVAAFVFMAMRPSSQPLPPPAVPTSVSPMPPLPTSAPIVSPARQYLPSSSHLAPPT